MTEEQVMKIAIVAIRDALENDPVAKARVGSIVADFNEANGVKYDEAAPAIESKYGIAEGIYNG